MAPLTIRHIVSFSSQDPKHPVENLLVADVARPWLSCPGDRSRQLRVELQLERACHIAYIDIGNNGSAFLQIDVGRSTWPVDKGFTTLLPTTALMSPADARAMTNHRGVRMFKRGDFLEGAVLERWDRVRVTCSQPYNRREQFGLSFIRLRSPESEDEDGRPAGGAPQDASSLPISPRHPKSTADAEGPGTWSHIEGRLREKLQQTTPPPPAGMSRSARMLQLSAARSQKRSRPITAPVSPPIPPHRGDSGSQQEDSPMSSGSCPETHMTRLRPSQKDHVTHSGRRRLEMVEARKRRRAQTRNSERHLTPRRERDRPSTAERSPETHANICPICAGHFPAAHLPVHAATCGEAPVSPGIVLSSDDDDDARPAAHHTPVSWVQCPLCGFPFQDTEIEGHASRCGE